MSFLLPVGTAYWIFFLISVTHSALLIFTPLFLQVLHGLTPLYIGYLSLVFSFGWTAGALIVSGWSGRLEHAGSVGGMLLTAACTAIMAAEIVTGALADNRRAKLWLVDGTIYSTSDYTTEIVGGSSTPRRVEFDLDQDWSISTSLSTMTGYVSVDVAVNVQFSA